ncbi:uncharacterized protein LOC135092012 [Scylla paramamosain]|uniref:uncharacterized protein LOC135092012 n=1 Tax=Scylla paramamosain TaxID=85552 RepID=UPI003082D30E
MFKTPQQTYLEFASEKLRALKRWLKSAAITTYDELVNLLALEEFMRKLPYSVMLHITNKEETDLLKAAQLADLFSLVNRKATSDKLTETPSGKINSGNSGVGKMTGSSTRPPLFCAFCKQPGHLIKNCPNPKCKVAQTYPAKPVASIQALPSFPVPKDLFEPFRSVGTISIDNKDHPVKIVRDTCSAQSLVLKSAVPGIEQCYTGEKVYLKDFHDPFPIALAKVHLDSPLVRGEVIIGVSEEPALPIPNAQLLLANDLAGSKVTPPLVISDTMLMDNPTVQLEEQQPGLFPVCATTRAQARKSDQSFSLPKKSPSPLELNQIFSEKLLTEAQQEDTTLTQFHDKVIPPDQITNYPAFYKQDGVLMRVFRPSKVPDAAAWAEAHQVVVPTILRHSILEIAHESFAGHLGIKKTCEKILADFYWPGLREDVKNYVSTCHLCQIAAFPIRKINTNTIVSKLNHFFTTFGIPQTIQSDRGTNFTSVLFTEVLKELGIAQTLSSAYHPQSQGALERFHQTLKGLLRKFCHEQESEWDDTLPYMLFAIREAPNESTGVSPFELLFGRKVRGPLRIIKDKLLDSTTHKLVSVTKYLNNLKATLTKVRTFADNNLHKSQNTMKKHFDQKARVRVFDRGDQVLAFIPTPKHPLQVKYHGPYEVVEKVGDNNYIINTPDRRKATQLIHVNLLKMYKCRTPVTGAQPTPRVASCGIIEPQEADSELKPASVCSLIMTCSVTILKSVNVLRHDVKVLPGTFPIKQSPYRVNPRKREQMQKEVQYLLEQGLAIPSSSPWASPCLLVPKEDGQLRFCADYRRVNAVTIPDAYPLPRVDDLIDEVGQAKFVTKLDLLKGYYQIALTERSQIVSAFITPFGLFQYVVAPFGMRNCPATFQRAMNKVMQGLKGVLVYLDDILIFSHDWDDHLYQIQNVLSRLQEANLTVKLAKSTFGAATVSYLGHQTGQGSVRPKTANVDAVLKYPTPTTRRELRRFLGMAGFYRRFCPNFADAAGPLTRLTSGNVAYEWTPACQHAFNQLKNLLAREPVLRAADFSKPFIIHTDASDHASGAALLQESDGIFHPVAYHSEKFNIHQKNYSTIEKELLAIISAIKKFEYYLQSNTQPLQIYTDHNPLTFLNRNRFTNQRLLRWSLQLQPYHIEMHHIKGLDNCLADTLSRLPTTPRITTRRDPEDPRILLPGMQSCLVNRSMEAAEGRALPEEPSTGPQTTHVLVESTFTGQEPPHFSNDAESFLLRHPKKGGMSHT